MTSTMTDGAVRRRQVRRLTGLQTMSFAVSCGSAVFFAAYFVADRELATSGGIAVPVTLIVAVLMLWLRSIHPPSIEPEVEGVEEPEPETSDTYGWEVGTFLVAAVVVPMIVVVGVLVRFIVPLGIIVGFWLAHDDVSVVSVLAAVGCCLAVLACVEYGIEMPLTRRWGLPRQTKPRPREDYCPPPPGGP